MPLLQKQILPSMILENWWCFADRTEMRVKCLERSNPTRSSIFAGMIYHKRYIVDCVDTRWPLHPRERYKQINPNQTDQKKQRETEKSTKPIKTAEWEGGNTLPSIEVNMKAKKVKWWCRNTTMPNYLENTLTASNRPSGEKGGVLVLYWLCR